VRWVGAKKLLKILMLRYWHLTLLKISTSTISKFIDETTPFGRAEGGWWFNELAKKTKVFQQRLCI